MEAKRTQAPYILILYYSQTGGTANLAEQIAQGVQAQGQFTPRLRTVPPVVTAVDETLPVVPDSGALYCSKEDLANCSGLALGTPTRFGSIAAPLKHFLDSTVDLWISNRLEGKPASLFCSTASLHGGQEMTLLTMLPPLLHHGMIFMGLPYSNKELNQTQTGGTPYGATHVAGAAQTAQLSDDEQKLARAQGNRLAILAHKLSD